MKEIIHEMYSEETIIDKVKELGEQISKDFEGEELIVVGILKGAASFTCELAKRISVPVYMDYMTVSSYGNGTVSSGTVTVKQDMTEDVAGKNVLVVEDIIDSGRTLAGLKMLLEERGAKTVRLATFLSKPSRREVEVDVDYIGYVIPDKFVVGYGLDYAQKYRNLPYIGVLEFVEE